MQVIKGMTSCSVREGSSEGDRSVDSKTCRRQLLKW